MTNTTSPDGSIELNTRQVPCPAGCTTPQPHSHVTGDISWPKGLRLELPNPADDTPENRRVSS